jgi:CRISPR/Cas system-associated protein Cas10 (large subunit of type III CRISPR-Cas system)
MRVRTVNARLRNLVNQIKSRNMPKRVRTPNCTHLDMDRVYGRDQQCNVCGRPPSIGFLYECRQDYDVATLHDLLAEDDDDLGEVTKSEVRMQLQWLGLSESVISTAEQGHYTHAQLEKLKAQKKELQQIISDSLQASHINNAAARLAALVQNPSNHDGASSSTVIKTTVRWREELLTRHPSTATYTFGPH